ncbi:cof family hydrolase [Psychromonas sp. CNPT3]|uniref:Cof-type HAD-IIB family hydrolase n=1 Tax=Psychromonas sp. CNPT3 TaxID=314282 RepID=UPI00006E568E|nr:Cof-type HAD-IIB family hydrolase [Psychromonas sp. CNPT3]AGH81508.1 cof family hydrolase [Psychromonas sp. CNPT3]
MYKLIALDMDGTLLNSQKELTPRVHDVIRRAKEKGIKVVLASGRPFEGMLPTLKALGLDSDDDITLTYNASLILKVASKEIISSALLDVDDALQLYELAKKLDVNVLAYSMQHGLITPKHNKYTHYEAELNKIEVTEFDFYKLSKDDTILKVMMIDEPEVLTRAIEKLPISLQDKYSMAKSMPFFFEFMNKKSNKGNGMQVLATYLGLSSEQIICVGDAANDLEMIKFAGLGVAMKNATDDVKAHANYITDSNDNDGVAKVFEKYLLND